MGSHRASHALTALCALPLPGPALRAAASVAPPPCAPVLACNPALPDAVADVLASPPGPALPAPPSARGVSAGVLASLPTTPAWWVHLLANPRAGADRLAAQLSGSCGTAPDASFAALLNPACPPDLARRHIDSDLFATSRRGVGDANWLQVCLLVLALPWLREDPPRSAARLRRAVVAGQSVSDDPPLTSGYVAGRWDELLCALLAGEASGLDLCAEASLSFDGALRLWARRWAPLPPGAPERAVAAAALSARNGALVTAGDLTVQERALVGSVVPSVRLALSESRVPVVGGHVAGLCRAADILGGDPAVWRAFSLLPATVEDAPWWAGAARAAAG